MILNRIWTGMILIAIVMGFSKLIFWEDTVILQKMVDSLSDAAKNGFEIALYLTGTLCVWMGIMKIGEDGGAVRIMSKAVAPLFSRLFPEVPAGHPAIGSMMMNISANMLGLDNAATPMGLKAMNDLQSLNEDKKTATNAQIMFLVLNASGLTIIPVSIFAARAAAKSEHVTDVFLPILIATFFATLAGIIYVGIRQRINLFNKVILAYIGGLTILVGGLIFYLNQFPEQVSLVSSILSSTTIFLFIGGFVALAAFRKVNVYDSFIEGAKGGFSTAINIMPFLVAMLLAIALFRSCGALDEILKLLKNGLLVLGLTAVEFIDALPVMLMKPFSGSGARGLMIEIFNNPKFGPDSFTGYLSSTFQGSTETTFYVLAVYFGSVGVSNTRYAATAGIICDIIGGIAAIFITYLFFS